jgi:DNA-binding CsgD family transcriptional regulator
MRAHWRSILGWGLLAATLLVSLELIRHAPLWLGLGRELVGAAVAILAVAVGVGIARWWYAPAERPTDGVAAPAPSTPSRDARADVDDPRSLPEQPGTHTAHPLDALSPREREVLRLLADGLSNKELARALNVSENTIKTHLANLYAKLGTRNRVQALARAQALGVTTANRVEPGAGVVSDG